MKQFPKTEVYSIFSILAGLAGIAMQSWLLTTVDHKGLLTRNHISAIISFLLLAAIVVVNILFLKKQKSAEGYKQMFPNSLVSGVGSFLAAVGFLFATLSANTNGLLEILVKVFGFLSVIALAFAGYCRLMKKRPNCLLYAVVAVFLILRTLVYCQGWSAEIQVERYFFPLLGSLCLLLAAYYRAALVIGTEDWRRYQFFRQIAIYSCLLSVVTGDTLFFLAGALWMTTDYCIPTAAEDPAE